MRELEEMCQRAFNASLSREKIFLTYPILLLASLICVFMSALLHNAHQWVVFGAVAIPIYLSLGLLGSLAVFIHRIYYHELKGETVNYKDLFKASVNRMLNGVLLALPLIIFHLLLWLFLGLFLLVEAIPYLGPIVAVLLSMLPFAFLTLMAFVPLLTFFALFYGSSYFSFDLQVDLTTLKEHPLSVLGHFLLAVAPLFVGGIFLGAVYYVTMMLFAVNENVIALSLQRLFLLVPFSFYLTPLVLFFFHFGLESYRQHLRK